MMLCQLRRLIYAKAQNATLLKSTLRTSKDIDYSKTLNLGLQHCRNFHSSRTLYAENRTEYDYVVVGAGSAGCVLANRLSADQKNAVNIIEAGPVDESWKIHMPERFVENITDRRYNWNYVSSPMKFCNNRTVIYPRGKVLGGSSSLNATVYTRGHPYDYDRWEKEGASGWSYTSVLPYFKRAQSHETGESLYKGGQGPLKVSRSKLDGPLHRAWVKAGVEAGYGYTDDFNGYRQEGVGFIDFTNFNGVRNSTATAYLKPAMQNKNLTVTTDTLVTKIIFDGKRAVGVETLNNEGQLEKVMANKEVILSGGAINSPHILMLSGVGNGDELKKHSIDIVQHIPGVGKNLQDHPALCVQHRVTKPVAKYSQIGNIHPNKLRSYLIRSGVGFTTHFDSAGFIRSKPGVLHPDILYLFLPMLYNNHGQELDPYDGLNCIVSPLRSESKGTISLQSNDPRQAPLMDFNYLSHKNDLFLFRSGIKHAREILAQSAFDEFRGEELAPGPHVQTDAQLDEFITNACEHIYHATCTCKMGSTKDNEVVVDPQLRVVGLDNLRIADASVMPSIISGTPNAPTIMIAERLSDMLLDLDPLPKMHNVPIWTPKFPHQQRDKD